jgi:lipopolysaccharide transport system permease protein
MVVFGVIFSAFLSVPTGGIPYPLFSYSVLIFWSFFSNSINFGVNSLVNNTALLTKIYFPREILLLAAIGASLVDLAVASVVFLGMMGYYRWPITAAILWGVPLLALQTALAYGVILIGAALNVFYRDIRFVVPLGLQLWLYATPIMYPIEVIPLRWRSIMALNPMFGIVQGYRSALLEGKPPDWSLLWPGLLITLGVLSLGYFYFKRAEWRFADVI